MKSDMNRRDFLGAMSAVGATALLSRSATAAPFRTTLHKAMIGDPTEETLSAWKAAGFEGMETSSWDVAPADAERGRRTAEKLGMKIHSVLRGWVNFNSEDASEVAKDIATVERALQAAQAYGADALLLVPCRVGGMPMPEAWEFEIEFDEKTGHVGKVAAGDNSRYEKYIAAQNRATDTSRIAIDKLIPVAEKTGVVIAIENVWNNLWVKPALLQNFVASFKNRWVQAYFDIGNHVKYAPPQDWIRTLGKLIVKCHVKDFLLKADGHGGDFIDIRDGSVDWPTVRRALDEIGYSGWMTIEEGGGRSRGLSVEEKNKRLELIISGK